MKGVIIAIIRKWLEKQGYSITNKEELLLEKPVSIDKKEEDISISFLFGLYRNKIKHVTGNAIVMSIIHWVGISILLASLPRIIQFLEILFNAPLKV